MRLLNRLSLRYFSHRLVIFTLGVCVGLKMHSAFWSEDREKKSDLVSRPPSPIGYFSDLRLFNPTPTEHIGPSDFDILHLNITADKESALKTLLRLNDEQKIRNGEKFSLEFGNDSVVILVQVHRRIEDLGIMIESLKSVRYINETLVIFSHDYYSRDLFELIHSIDFCPVLQLFYPYAIQFYDKRFPGDSPGDCPRNIGRLNALKINCYNANYSDSYGHYREGKYTQIKHHWLWKQHFLFDRIRVLKEFSGTVLRLDDDYFLAEDVVHVIRILDDVKPVTCPGCLMYILGEHEKLKWTTYERQADEAVRSFYFTGIGRGMAFKKDFWDMFKSCASSFCKFDDYNWDWALENAASKCFKGVKILKPIAGRIFHIGTCQGFHRNVKHCDKYKVKADVLHALTKFKANLYPKTFKVTPNKAKIRTMSGYGGWGDPRDRELCMGFVNNATEGEEAVRKINKIIST